MISTGKQQVFVDYLNNSVFPSLDFSRLEQSYNTDLVYAKEILGQLHKAMITAYGSGYLNESDGDDGFVMLPGVLQSKKSNRFVLFC
jgi:hypothetical protein